MVLPSSLHLSTCEYQVCICLDLDDVALFENAFIDHDSLDLARWAQVCSLDETRTDTQVYVAVCGKGALFRG
jgi:hypothetical protein